MVDIADDHVVTWLIKRKKIRNTPLNPLLIDGKILILSACMLNKAYGSGKRQNDFSAVTVFY